MREEKHSPKSRVVKVDSEESWDSFINQSKNEGRSVVVHFTAAWCIPSVVMKAVFDKLAYSYQDTLFLLVDVDEVKGVASKMEVKAMPTFLLINEGVRLDMLVGANPDELRKRIHAFVRSKRSL